MSILIIKNLRKLIGDSCSLPSLSMPIIKNLKFLNTFQYPIISNKTNKSSFAKIKALDETFLEIKSDMLEIYEESKTKDKIDFTPMVIEPSFGLSRIMCALFEHRRFARDDGRVVFAFPASIAPIKVSIFPLMRSDARMNQESQNLSDQFSKAGICYHTDPSGASIGKRYARSDIQGIPFALTIDNFTVEAPNLITLRDRDSMKQIRIPVFFVTHLDLCF